MILLPKRHLEKKMEFAVLCTDGELYTKALHLSLHCGLFVRHFRRKFDSSTEKLGKHQGGPVPLFHTAGFSTAQVFSPLALGPSKDEC